MTLGWVNWRLGYGVSVLAFYALPITVAVWRLGNTAGVITAIVSTAVRVLVRKFAVGAPPLPPRIEVWNAVMMLANFLIFFGGAAAMRFQMETLRRRVKTLTGILRICNCCKKIRDENGYWNSFETFLDENTGAAVSHKICPDCSRKLSAGERPEPALPESVVPAR